MIKSAAVALTLASVVLAQSSTQSAASGIPTGITSSCSAFLTQLDTNPDINNCLTSLIDATAQFDPSSGTTPSTADVTSTLNNLCGSSVQKCNSSTIRGLLANFYTQCSTDMLGTAGDGSNGNRGVIDIYDVLYILTPLQGAICAKDNGQFCATTMTHSSTSNNNSGSSNGASSDTPAASGNDSSAAPSSSGSASQSASASPSTVASSSSSAHSASATHAKRHISPHALYKRHANVLAARGQSDQDNLGDIAPNAATYNTQGLPYLFLTANITNQAQLCTPCVSKVVGSYISFESAAPYALGIANSPMLSGQVALWGQIKNTCPQEFTTGLLTNATSSITNAGGNDDSSGALAQTALRGVTTLVSAAVVAAVGAWLF